MVPPVLAAVTGVVVEIVPQPVTPVGVVLPSLTKAWNDPEVGQVWMNGFPVMPVIAVVAVMSVWNCVVVNPVVW